ncbi:hypothetical protein DACRYDRAFT_115426 [Dacryopinax primogenitus]|uniref:Cep57 centrosome microtubule-binding domain-containing protein n=1 Tax=Dacryopinax primogenitus (strain DJM 731) TaxID=1858805 RepID=M5GEF6_DACPD|nr:uncharacterized protein DACRYDRAFT_115426 [Dacryopinax primogenitus]EJU03198.1 hypothetical protein DACRYDRAFT_115426 [Dacryopinax primogenitus]
MARRDSQRPDPLDDYVQRPPIAKSTSERERMIAERTLESHLSVVYQPSPAGTDDDLSVEYGRTRPLSPVNHEASFMSFSAQAPPHIAADYSHMIDDRFGPVGLDDSLGLTGLDISKSSAGHHMANVTLHAGFGGKATSPTASNIAFEPSRDVDDIKKGGHMWAQNGREIHDNSPRATRSGRRKLVEALPSNFSPKRVAADLPRKHPLMMESPKYPTRATRTSHEKGNGVSSPLQSPEDGPSSAFGRHARTLRHDMGLANAGSEQLPKVASRPSKYGKGDSIQLPDLTGLTSAVVTPAKPHVFYLQAQTHSPMEREVLAERRRHCEAQQRMSAHRDELDRLSGEVMEKEAEIADLQCQLRTERAGRYSHTNNGSDRIAELERLHSNLDSLRIELVRAEETLRKQGSVLEELRLEKQRDEERLRDMQRAYDRTFQDLRRKREEVGRLQRDVARLKAHYENMKALWNRHIKEQQQHQPETMGQEGIEQDDSSVDDAGESPYAPTAPAWRTERRQLSAVTEEDDEDLQDHPDEAHGGPAVPEMSTGSVSSLGTPVDPPEPDSPRFNQSFHNTSIVSDLAGPSQGRQKPLTSAGDVADLDDEVAERRSFRSLDSIHDSPPLMAQSRLPEPRQRPSSAPPLSSRLTGNRQPLQPHVTTSLQNAPVPPSSLQDSTLPRPRLKDERVERLFHVSGVHDAVHCWRCQEPHEGTSQGRGSTCAVNIPSLVHRMGEGHEAISIIVIRALEEEQRRRALTHADDGRTSQELLTNAIKDMEGDFTHYRSVYSELAEQYGVIAPKNRIRRNILAEHLGEVISILERKGDLIATLYDSLGNIQRSQ